MHAMLLLLKIPVGLVMALLNRAHDLTEDDRPLLERWLRTCLVSRDHLREHLRVLQSGKTQFSADETAWPPEKLNAVLNDGLESLSTRDLASLASAPLTLHELFDRVQETMPPRWQPAMAEHGRLLREKHGLRHVFPHIVLVVVHRPLSRPLGPLDDEHSQQTAVFDLKENETGSKEIPLPDWLAQECYEVPHQTVEITLHTAQDAKDPTVVTPHLEFYPAPKKALTVALQFPNADLQEIIIDAASGSMGKGQPLARALVENAGVPVALEIRPSRNAEQP